MKRINFWDMTKEKWENCGTDGIEYDTIEAENDEDERIAIEEYYSNCDAPLTEVADGRYEYFDKLDEKERVVILKREG